MPRQLLCFLFCPFPGYFRLGSRRELTQRALLAQVTQELQNEVNEPPPIAEYKSVTQKDFFDEEFKSELPPPQYEHNVNTEQPITFWSQHKEKIHVSMNSPLVLMFLWFTWFKFKAKPVFWRGGGEGGREGLHDNQRNMWAPDKNITQVAFKKEKNKQTHNLKFRNLVFC